MAGSSRPNPYPTANAFMPQQISLPTLREAAAGCKGCDLYQRGTQTVFGEGAGHALVMFVGEQPGDQEDRSGHPFVGPAGQLLDRAMQEAGIQRDEVYVTNAVKHFKWEPRGKRRIHVKPSAREVAACKPWLLAEIEVTRPRMIVCLGATAAQALLGSDFRVTQHRGQVIENPHAPWMLATVHPSSLLRIPDAPAREAAYQAFVEDLRIIARQLGVEKGRPRSAAGAHPGQATREPTKPAPRAAAPSRKRATPPPGGDAMLFP